MELWQISILIIAISVLVLVGFMVPVLIQLRRSVKKFEDVSRNLDQRLPTILASVDNITANVSNITDAGKHHAETIGLAVTQIKGMVDDVASVEKTIKYHMDSRLIRSLTTITAGAKAANAFVSVIRNGQTKKGSRPAGKRRFFKKSG